MGSLNMAKEKSLGLMDVSIQAPGFWTELRGREHSFIPTEMCILDHLRIIVVAAIVSLRLLLGNFMKDFVKITSGKE